MNGYEHLKEAVMQDCNESNHCGCFNPNGCKVPGNHIGEYGNPGYKSCFHKYCDKFVWVVERAKHYEKVTGIPWEQVLGSWEEKRSYWYMNYYQDANQPKLEDGTRVFDKLEDLYKSVGNSGYRCPACGKVSKSPYECTNNKCNYKVYGLFGDLGKGVFVFVKETISGEKIFMPVAWETKETKKGKNND